MTAYGAWEQLDAAQGDRGRSMDPRRLSQCAAVRFKVGRIYSARLLWLNNRWFLEHGVNVMRPAVRRDIEEGLLGRYAVQSIGSDEAELREHAWFEADLYGGTGGALHGGSGRCGHLGAFNAKGIGKTPLVSKEGDSFHTSGLLSLNDALREAVGAEVCRAELPYGAVPILAIIDTGFTHRVETSAAEERCAIVVRPNFIRPAHFERSIFFGASGTMTSHQFIDASRVRQSVQTLGREAAGYPSVRETFTRLARQLGAARARRLWQGRVLSSNLSIAGAFVDLGSFRTVPNWRQCVGLAGECFGSELRQLRLAFASVLYYFARYSQSGDLEFAFKTVYDELAQVENDAFLDACFDGLGVPRERFGPQPALQELLLEYFRVQQATTVGDDADSEPFSVYQILCGIHNPSATSRVELRIANRLLRELDRLQHAGLPVCRGRTRMFFEPRWRLKYANAVASAREAEGRVAQAVGAADAAELIRRHIEDEYSASVRACGSLSADVEVLKQATDVASTVLECRNLRSGEIELRAEGPVLGDSIFVLGQGVDTRDLKLQRVPGTENRGWFQQPLFHAGSVARDVPAFHLHLPPLLRDVIQGDVRIVPGREGIKECTNRLTACAENVAERQNSAMFGHALRLLWAIDCKHTALGQLAQRLWPAVRLKQIEVLFNSKGSPVGYATWAFLTDDCARQLCADPDYILHLSEWNEGDQLWLLDVVAMPGHVRNLVRKLRERRLPAAMRVQGVRRRTNTGGTRHVRLGILRVRSNTSR